MVSDLSPAAGGARLAIGGELGVRLAPRGHEAEPGQRARLRLQSDLDVTLGQAPPRELEVKARPHALGLTCRASDPARPGGLVLSACYADLVSMIALSLDTPEADALDSLRTPVDAVLPRGTPDGHVRWTLERLGLSAAGRDWLRVDARASFVIKP